MVDAWTQTSNRGSDDEGDSNQKDENIGASPTRKRSSQKNDDYLEFSNLENIKNSSQKEFRSNSRIEETIASKY